MCAKCRDVARKSNVLTFESERVARAELESRLTVRCEENFDRHLAMQKRRGRRYDPDFVRPTRDPELVGMKYSKGKDDDTPIGSWAAAKHYVPPPEERPRANLLDDGWEPATAAGRAVFGITTCIYGRHEQGYKHEHGERRRWTRRRTPGRARTPRERRRNSRRSPRRGSPAERR